MTNKQILITVIVIVLLFIVFAVSVKANSKKAESVVPSPLPTPPVGAPRPKKTGWVLPIWCNPNDPGKNWFGWDSETCINPALRCDPNKVGYTLGGLASSRCGTAPEFECDPNRPGYTVSGTPSVECGFFG